MPWVKLSDDWYDDYELVEAGPAAMLLWTVAISWCARNLTDGRVPLSQVPRLVDWSAIGTTAEQVIAPLVANGRLQAIEGGYQITNYLTYQPSRQQVLEEREAAKARAAKSRGSAPQVHRTIGAGADPPDPVPVPEGSSSSSSTVNGTTPDDLWTTIADRKCKAQRVPPHNPTAWKRKAAQNAELELGERAQTLLEQYDLTPSQLADCLLSDSNPTWLNGLRKRATA